VICFRKEKKTVVVRLLEMVIDSMLQDVTVFVLWLMLFLLLSLFLCFLWPEIVSGQTCGLQSMKGCDKISRLRHRLVIL